MVHDDDDDDYDFDGDEDDFDDDDDDNGELMIITTLKPHHVNESREYLCHSSANGSIFKCYLLTKEIPLKYLLKSRVSRYEI